MKYCWGVILFVVLLYGHALGKKRSVCLSNGNREKIRVTCRQKGIIFQPEVVGFSSPDCNHGIDTCMGLSSNLIVQKHKCFWKNSCEIRLKRKGKSMITECYKETKSILLNKGWCITKGTPIHDLMRQQKKRKSKYRELDLSKPVIIRSHRSFPWNYKYVSCNSMLSFRVVQSDIGGSVVFSVRSLDIEQNYDELFITHAGKRMNITNDANQPYYSMPVTELSSVNLTFRHYDGCFTNEMSRGRGFVICMKILKKGDVIRRSVCEEIMKSKIKISKCDKRKKKNRGKGKKKKCKKVSKHKKSLSALLRRLKTVSEN